MKKLVSLVVFFSFFVGVSGLPLAPKDVELSAVETGIRISWDYGQNAFFFNVYRGNSFEDANIIASVPDFFFVDDSVEANVQYFYFVTALNAVKEESYPSQGFSVKWTGVKKPVFGGKDFNIVVLKPDLQKATFSFGDKVDFVVRINSTNFSSLKNLKIILLNNDLGLRKDFDFNSVDKTFFASIILPEEKDINSLPTKYEIWGTASLNGKEILDSKEIRIYPVPKQFVNAGGFAQPVLFGIVILTIAIVLIIAGLRLFLQKKTERNALWLERLEVLRARAILSYDWKAGRRTNEQFREEEYVLQGKQGAIEQKLGLAKEKTVSVKPNPFDGCTQNEIIEIYGIAKMMQAKKKEMTQESMRAWLVQNGKSEKIAKKVVEVVWEK